MSPHLTTVLALALCLGLVLQAQEGVLPRPSIWAEPGSVIPQGQPVTIVCQGPAKAETFRLEKEGNDLYPDVQNPQHETQARFPIPVASEDTAGFYRCLYHNGVAWSKRSEPLQLNVTGDPQMHWEDSNSPGLLCIAEILYLGLSTERISILTGVSVTLFLCVFLLVLILLYYQHQKKHSPPGSKGEEQRPQERVSPAVDILERTPDLAAVDRLPEKDGEMLRTPTPTAGGPPDVTYAQLDHWILTQRTAQAASPRSMEPTAESSTYAALARH
ncbi:leukocyte-associated immunoglobulin-like receptor 1 isoform X1 [Eumetopias jubatus]|uniref:leukocyte-associated immunoglobulin-like receptor 1 isoform X1 n=1 Tax=Eumetopias jubatus TaxID=34886 RepID=UPI001015FEC9|nr:leukocyte-associated immunoglobulin-like receptor 1 isoform X1 [Eumetopias jubatus]